MQNLTFSEKYNKKNKLLTIDTLDVFFLFAFFISFANSALGFVFYLLTLLYCKEGIKGNIKAMLMITTRGLMNTALASYPMFPEVKLPIILIHSLIIIFRAKVDFKDIRLKRLTTIIFVFSCFTLLSSLLFSSYPVTAIFKLISFSIAFIAIMCGVRATASSFNYINYFVVI